MTLTTLSNNERAGNRWTHKVELTYADFVANAAATDTSETVEMITAPIGTAVLQCACHVTTDFVNSEAGVTAVAMTVGDGGSVARYLASTVVGEGTVVDYLVELGSNDTYPYAYTTAADTIDAVITCTGGSNNYVSTLTAGAVTVLLELSDLSSV